MVLLVILSSASVWAQAPRFQNVHRLEVPGSITATVTANGYVYVAGGLVRWRKGPLRAHGGDGPPHTGYNAFVAKWNPTTHRLVWLKEMGRQPGGADQATALVVRGSNVYVLGSFEQESEGFGHPIKSAFGLDLFVARLTDHGSRATAEWTQPLGYAVNSVTETVSPQANHLACEGSALYVAGTTDTEPSTWDPATGTKVPNIKRAFVAKLTDAGARCTPIWKRTWVVDRSYYDIVTLTSQQGKLYLGTNSWQPTPDREEPTSTLKVGALPRNANYRLHFTQFSDQGSRYHLDWTHTEAGQGAGVAVAGNAFYIVGREDADQSFGQTSQPANAHDVPGDLFVAKLVLTNTTVRPAWVQRLRGTGHDEYATLACIAIGGRHVYVAGTFGTPSLSVGATVINPKAFSPVNDSEADLFVAQLTDAGVAASFDWAQRLGGTYNDHLRAFSLVGSRLYVSGFFDGDFGSPILFGKQQFLLQEDSGILPEVLLQAWLPLTK